jgi:phage N-6-adenine-methyltransferase
LRDTMMRHYLNQVFWRDALSLLRALPSEAVDAVIADPMFGVAADPKPHSTYDWGVDPAKGDPDRWWAYHRPIYQECLRVLRPDGKLAWAMGCKFHDRFPEWFGGFRVWSFTRFMHRGMNAFGHVWVVQTREQEPVRFPDADGLIIMEIAPALLKEHPCPKALPEMHFLVEHLTEPNDIVLDCFAGIGTTLVAAQQLGRRWIGCDLSRNYCRIAIGRLADLRSRPGRAQGKVDTSTPQWLFDTLNEQVRALTGEGFQLDAAAAEWNAKCEVYFDERTDALRQDWSRWPTIFCNPPFRSELIARFATRALEAAGKGSTVVLLLPYWQGYPWFQKLKRRGQLQDIVTPVAFEWPDGSTFVFNKDRRTLVVVTLGPKVRPGTNGEPIAKGKRPARGEARG